MQIYNLKVQKKTRQGLIHQSPELNQSLESHFSYLLPYVYGITRRGF